MPYITPKRKKQLAEGALPRDGGDLNYLFTKRILKGGEINKFMFLDIFNEFWARHSRYNQGINVIGGAVVNCAMEFAGRGRFNKYRQALQTMADAYDEWYRAVARAYEDKKIQKNGDVFE